jgi:hypothetical protein
VSEGMSAAWNGWLCPEDMSQLCDIEHRYGDYSSQQVVGDMRYHLPEVDYQELDNQH